MELAAPFTAKSLATCEPGELVMFCSYDGSGSEFGLILDKSEFDTKIAFMKTNRASHQPHIRKIKADEPCISYGDVWVLEIEQPQRLNPDLRGQPNTVGIRPTGACFYFGRAPREFDSAHGYLNLETFRIEPDDGASFYFDKWKVWANATERARVGAEPLFTNPSQEKTNA